MKQNKAITSLLAMMICLGLPGITDGSERFTHELDTFEVNSTPLFQNIGASGRRIQLIEGADIAHATVGSVDELLRYVPGVDVQMRNAFGVQSDFSIRGSTFNQVMVLIDGMPLNDPLTGHFSSYIPVVPEEISRIEVIQGPSAALYGPDAVGGVINIVTKTHEGTDTPSAGLSYERGDHRLSKAQGGFYTRQGEWNFGGGLQSNTSSGHPIDENRNADFNINTVSGSAGREVGEQWYVSARGAYDYRDFSAVNFYTTVPVDSSRETVSHIWGQASAQRRGENSRTRLNATFRQTEDRFVFQEQLPANEHVTDRAIFRADHHYTLSPQLSVQGGVQGDYRSIVSTDRGDHEDWHTGIFLNGAYVPFSGFTLTVGGRLDYDDTYGAEVAPQASVSYQTEGWTFRGLVGRSTRNADYTERYNGYNHDALAAGQNLGNPALKVESAMNYEAGADYQFRHWLRGSVTGFMRSGSNLIDWVQREGSQIDVEGGPALEADELYFFAQNLRRLQTRGIEVTLSGHWQGNRHGLQYEAGYTRLHSSAPEDGEVTKYIAGHPNHMVQSTVQWHWGRLSAGLNGIYKHRDAEQAEAIGAEVDTEYMIANGRISWEMEGMPLRLSMQVLNLTDRKYSDLLGAQMPGRWMMGGLQYRM